MPWTQLTLQCDKAHTAPLEDLLLDYGAASITLEDAQDQPILEPGVGEMPLWESVTLKALWEGEHDLTPVLLALQPEAQHFTLPADALQLLPDQPWERAWLEHFKPMAFGSRLWVCPSGQTAPEANAITVFLDPGLAFGTGTHPTTALCLEWLDAQDLTGKTIIDYGCGSGILAIAALKLGAQHAYCIDNDPQALLATQDNAERNQISADRYTTGLPNTIALPKVDVLIANILAQPLQSLAPLFATLLKPNGLFALSGILKTQLVDIQQAYQKPLTIETVVTREDWVRVNGTHQHPVH